MKTLYSNRSCGATLQHEFNRHWRQQDIGDRKEDQTGILCQALLWDGPLLLLYEPETKGSLLPYSVWVQIYLRQVRPLLPSAASGSNNVLIRDLWSLLWWGHNNVLMSFLSFAFSFRMIKSSMLTIIINMKSRVENVFFLKTVACAAWLTDAEVAICQTTRCIKLTASLFKTTH